MVVLFSPLAFFLRTYFFLNDFFLISLVLSETKIKIMSSRILYTCLWNLILIKTTHAIEKFNVFSAFECSTTLRCLLSDKMVSFSFYKKLWSLWHVNKIVLIHNFLRQPLYHMFDCGYLNWNHPLTFIILLAVEAGIFDTT